MKVARPRKRRDAWELVKYAVSPKVQAQWHISTGYILSQARL